MKPVIRYTAERIEQFEHEICTATSLHHEITPTQSIFDTDTQMLKWIVPVCKSDQQFSYCVAGRTPYQFSDAVERWYFATKQELEREQEAEALDALEWYQTQLATLEHN